jgi:hypothetical protein
MVTRGLVDRAPLRLDRSLLRLSFLSRSRVDSAGQMRDLWPPRTHFPFTRLGVLIHYGI